jgi:hypothetical protein
LETLLKIKAEIILKQFFLRVTIKKKKKNKRAKSSNNKKSKQFWKRSAFKEIPISFTPSAKKR